MAVYTDEQIKSVCDKATETLHDLTDAQNVTFPTAPIIEGMKAGLDANTIANNARDSISGLPMYNNGFINTVGNAGFELFNLASYMRGAVYEAITALNTSDTPSQQEQEGENEQPEQPVVDNP